MNVDVTSREAILIAKNLSKSYGSFEAVTNVGLEVRKGEFVSILGPSGCGKTTLLRMLAGLEVPSRGSIRIDGEDCTRISANRRPTNMVFQSYALFPHLNIEENVAYGLHGKGLSSKQINERVLEMLDLVRLPGVKTRFPHQLSGGQRQRIGLARALACQPKVLLLDEPLSALDKSLREAMQSELRTIQQRVGISFVLVTHDQEEAFSLSDRVMVMSGGRVAQFADPLTLYHHPASLQVAQFVGDINLLQGQVSTIASTRAAVEIAGIRQLFARNTEGTVLAGDSVVIGVRPEKIKILKEGALPSDDDRNQVKARYLRSSFKGDRYLHHLEVGESAKEFQVVTHNADSTALSLIRNESVTLTWRVADTMLFNSTG